VLEGNALHVDGADRTDEASITLGAQTVINASGKVAATAALPRVDHTSVADCHVPTAKLASATAGLSKKDPVVAPLANASKVAAQCQREVVCNCKIFAECAGGMTPEPSQRYPLHSPEHYCAVYGLCGKDLPKHLVDRKRAPTDECATCGLDKNCCSKGGTWEGKCPAQHSWEEGNAACLGLGDTNAATVGVWQDCTTVEWTVATPDLSLEIGVVGPFEEGFLNEDIGGRTFNIAVSRVKSGNAIQGIINGDRNGFFRPAYKPSPWNPGALVPMPETHGNAREVTADTVADKAVLFSPGHMAKLDAACGPSQALEALKVERPPHGMLVDTTRRGPQ